jgi:hypothetical protein
MEWKRSVQMPGCVLEELEEELGVQKGMCPCASRSWRLSGMRGHRGGAWAEVMRRGGRKGEPARGREGGGKAGNDAWSRRKAGGGAGDGATVSGGEAQLGQTTGDVARVGGGQREGEKRRGRGRGGTWRGPEQRRDGRGGTHGWDNGGGARQRRTEEREREVDEEGPKCNIIEMQGPYCNAYITFKPRLKWRWAQKQKCMVFQNVQLCFKVHPQKR